MSCTGTPTQVGVGELHARAARRGRRSSTSTPAARELVVERSASRHVGGGSPRPAARSGARRTARARRATRCRARRGAPRRPRRRSGSRRCRSNPSPSGAARRARRCSARRAPRCTWCRAGRRGRPRCRGRCDSGCAALRARVAGLDDRHDVGPLRRREVAAEHRVAHVVVDLVRAGDPAVRRPHRRVGDDDASRPAKSGPM